MTDKTDMIRVTTHGAGGEVGRSCIEINHAEKRILFDAGLKIDQDDIVLPSLPENLATVDAVFLSHAHLDHSGALPYFNANGLQSPIYANRMTKVISKMLLKDSWKIDMINNRDPSYKKTNITQALGLIKEVNYDVEYTKKELTFTYYDAGHIPGSASILLKLGDKKILYTGDINTQDTELLKGADFYTDLPAIDLMITESTYGDRIHPDRQKEIDRFLSTIHETIEKGGKVIIPTFAVGRAQEILLLLRDQQLDVPVYLDGMAVKITNHYLQLMTYIKDFHALDQAAQHTHFIQKNPQRREALTNRGIFITTSGMMDGGPVIEYLKKYYDDTTTAILLTGYQVETSNGARLLREGKVMLDGKEYSVRCHVDKFDFSAHIGKKALEQMITTIKPKHLMLVHGDPDALLNLKQLAEQDGVETTIATNDTEYEFS